MKISRLIFIGLLGLVLAANLSGCIISTSPGTKDVILMRPGETKVFKVNGLSLNSPTSLCEWYIERYDGDPHWEEGTSLVFTVNPEGEKSNKVKIAFTYSMLLYTEHPEGYWGWGWVPVDHRVWNIRIPRNTEPVWDGDYYIESSSDIENLNGYTDITGKLAISDSDIKDLSGLENLSSVGGLSILNNDALTSLKGLENITSIDGVLWFYANPALKSLAALGNVTSIEGDISFYYNSALTSLTGLENITSVDGDLYIRNNRALTSLTGLENITSVGGDLTIVYSPALTSLAELGNITSVGGDLVIRDSYQSLTSLTGLKNITSVGGDLFISYNNALTSLGLASLQNVGSDFTISYNPMLCISLAEELMNQVLAGGGIGGEISIKGNKGC